MSQFEDNLWGSVVDSHGEDLVRAGAPVAMRAGRMHMPLLAGATGVLTAAVAAVMLLTGSAASPSPAFAVTVHKQSVSVTIHSQSGIAAANRKLVALGIHHRLTHVENGQTVTLICIASAPGTDGQSATYAVQVYSSAGAPAVGSTMGSSWHVVDCPSLVNAGNAGNTATTSAG